MWGAIAAATVSAYSSLLEAEARKKAPWYETMRYVIPPKARACEFCGGGSFASRTCPGCGAPKEGR